MAKHSKAYRAAVEKIGDATYAPLEAFAMVKEVATTKFDQTIEDMKMNGEIAKKHGMTLLYHNHDFEFTKVGDE